jgi:hypothetical protein
VKTKRAQGAWISLPALALMAAAAVGCGGGHPASPGAGNTGGGGGGAAGASGQAGAGEGGAGSAGAAGTSPDAGACGPRNTQQAPVWMATSPSAMATIVDETGAPVAGQPAYITGINISSAPATTSATGAVSILTALTFTDPVFKYGDGINYAQLTVMAANGTNDYTVGGTMTLVTGKLSDKPAVALTPGTTAISGDVAVTVPAGGTVQIDPLVYDSADSQKLRTVPIPVGKLARNLGQAGTVADFALIYGVAPAETTFCPAVSVAVTLPHQTATAYNDLGWAPGTAVEFWVTTTDAGQIYAPFAGWSKMSDGTVSSDGTAVITASGPGQGFVFLETFAIRKGP